MITSSKAYGVQPIHDWVHGNAPIPPTQSDVNLKKLTEAIDKFIAKEITAAQLAEIKKSLV